MEGFLPLIWFLLTSVVQLSICSFYIAQNDFPTYVPSFTINLVSVDLSVLASIKLFSLGAFQYFQCAVPPLCPYAQLLTWVIFSTYMSSLSRRPVRPVVQSVQASTLSRCPVLDKVDAWTDWTDWTTGRLDRLDGCTDRTTGRPDTLDNWTAGQLGNLDGCTA